MKRWVRAVAAAVVCGAMLLTGCAGCTGKDAVDQSGGTFKFHSATKPGTVIAEADRKTAGNVTGTLVSGGNYSLAAARGKVVVVNFWATWCIPCQTETPQLDLLYREMHPDGIDIVGIETKKEVSRSASTSFIADNKISFPIVWDEPGRTAVQLGHIPATSLPFTVVIDKQQRVAAIYLQAITPADLRPVLTTLAAES